MSLLLVLTGLIGQWLLGVGCAELLLRRSSAAGGRRSRFISAEQVGLGLVLGVAATSGVCPFCIRCWAAVSGLSGV